MRKQLLTVLALAGMLLIGGHSSAWADTEVTVTWPFNTGKEGQTATIDQADYFYGSYVTLGSNLSYNGTGTAGTVTETKIKMNSQNSSATVGTDNIDLMFAVKKGITFTPSSISFTATRYGTNGGKIDVYWVNGDGKTTKIKEGEVPNRDNAETKYSEYSYSLSEMSGVSTDATEGVATCGLRLFIYNADGKSYGLGNIVIKGTLTGTVGDETVYTITTSASPKGAGIVTQDLAGVYVGKDKKITFSATANAGYKFLNKWTVNGTEYEGETYTIDALSANTTVVALFEAFPEITFAKPDDVTCINRAFPANINTIEKGGTYTLPYNYMYYKDGYTMTGWNDGTTDYACGATYTVTGDVTLTPVFTKNTKSISDRSSRVSVKYDFARKTNNGRYVNIENNADIFVTTATVDGETIDVKLDVNCNKSAGVSDKKGKVNNTSSTAEAQVNVGTVFTVPMVKGGVVKLVSTKVNFSSTTFNDNKGVYDGKTATYTATEDGDVKIIVKEENHFFSYIQVTYPVDEKITVTEDKLMKSLCLAEEATIPTGVTAYTGALDETAGTVTLTAIDGGVIPAGEAVIVKADKAGDFTFSPSATGASKSDNNSLLGVTTQTNITDLAKEGKTVLAFGLLNNVYGFRLPANTYIGANRAYLYVTTATDSEAKSISVVFDDDNTTGINTVKTAEAQNAPVFNLAGQRVSNATKGLLIKNGKKFINK